MVSNRYAASRSAANNSGAAVITAMLANRCSTGGFPGLPDLGTVAI